MKHSLIVAIFVTLCTVCQGRLGESESELIARLGQPKLRLPERITHQGRIKEIGENLLFDQADWTIKSTLIEGRVGKEHYTKVGTWTDDQLRAILTANAQGATWREEKSPLPGAKRTWKRTDGAQAIWISTGGMAVEHPRYLQATSRAKAQAEAESRQVPKI